MGGNTHDNFGKEYYKFVYRLSKISETVKKMNLLTDEEIKNAEKRSQQDILEYGVRLVSEGTDKNTINNILSKIIRQENDKYTRQLMNIKKEFVLQMYAYSNPLYITSYLNSIQNYVEG
jgi:flagellar motor component MotA